MPAIAKKNKIPMLRSATPQPGVIGMTMNESSSEAMAIAGASTKKVRSANGGIQSSLKKILSMSAAICKSPNGPTRLGP